MRNEYMEIIKKQQEIINQLLALAETELTSVPINNPAESLKGVNLTQAYKEYNQQDFRKYLAKKGLSDNTIASYTTGMKLYFKKYGVISTENLEAWEAELKKNCKPKTINIRIAGMQKYFDFIKFDGYEFTKVKVQQKTFCDTAINEEQYNKLIGWALTNSVQVYKIAKIIGYTGVRVSELIELKTVDLEKGYRDITGKGNKTRRIYFTQSLIDDIKPYCQNEYLITNRYGTQMTTRGVSSLLYNTADKAGIPKEVMHPHSFRHYFAKQFLKHENDITLLGDLLGHSNISTTAIYTRRTSEEQQEALNDIVKW